MWLGTLERLRNKWRHFKKRTTNSHNDCSMQNNNLKFDTRDWLHFSVIYTWTRNRYFYTKNAYERPRYHYDLSYVIWESMTILPIDARM